MDIFSITFSSLALIISGITAYYSIKQFHIQNKVELKLNLNHQFLMLGDMNILYFLSLSIVNTGSKSRIIEKPKFKYNENKVIQWIPKDYEYLLQAKKYNFPVEIKPNEKIEYSIPYDIIVKATKKLDSAPEHVFASVQTTLDEKYTSDTFDYKKINEYNEKTDFSFTENPFMRIMLQDLKDKAENN